MWDFRPESWLSFSLERLSFSLETVFFSLGTVFFSLETLLAGFHFRWKCFPFRWKLVLYMRNTKCNNWFFFRYLLLSTKFCTFFMIWCWFSLKLTSLRYFWTCRCQKNLFECFSRSFESCLIASGMLWHACALIYLLSATLEAERAPDFAQMWFCWSLMPERKDVG